MIRGARGALVLALGLLCDTSHAATADKGDPCKNTAKCTLTAALGDACADYWLAAAIAENLPDAKARKEAMAEAGSTLHEDTEEAWGQYDARLDVCQALGGERYDPDIESDEFLSPEKIAANPNPYMPLVPGVTRVYRCVTDEGTETVTVHVTRETRKILGVTCIVVHDVAELDGNVIEDTLDWYAQDEDGNVWYFGEQSIDYENDKVSGLDGSWEAGENGALPGIIMRAHPVVGDVYRQEFAAGEAEDLGRILNLDASEDVPYGAYSNCLQTADFTPMEPGVLEHKYYAPGVGKILAVHVNTGTREELIKITRE